MVIVYHRPWEEQSVACSEYVAESEGGHFDKEVAPTAMKLLRTEIGPNGSNRKRGLYTSKAKQARVIAASLAGKSNREISRQIGIKRDTVARILSQPEVQELIAQYRQQVRELVPLCLAGLEAKLVTAKGKLRNRTDWRMLVEILKGTQVLVPKLEEEVTKKDELEGRSREELRFFIEHGGSWPEELGSTGESGEKAEGTGSGGPLPN